MDTSREERESAEGKNFEKELRSNARAVAFSVAQVLLPPAPADPRFYIPETGCERSTLDAKLGTDGVDLDHVCKLGGQACSHLRACRIRLQPLVASPRAIWRPMPRLLPVTKADFIRGRCSRIFLAFVTDSSKRDHTKRTPM